MIIKQGEIWLVEFFPQVGGEIAKRRPAVVVNDDRIGKLPLKTVVPVTDFKPAYATYPWMLKIAPNTANGLSKPSAADCFQIKNFSDSRFVNRLGSVTPDTLLEIHRTILKTLNPLYEIEPVG